jgi:acetyl esterase
VLSQESIRALELQEDLPLPGEAPISTLRDAALEFRRRMTADGPPVRMALERATLPGGRELPLRIYVPSGTPGGTLLWVHGGGWFSGSADIADPACRTLASEAGWTVISVDYPLSPEHRYPTALEGVHAAACAAREIAGELDDETGDQLAIGGDSAGGNLAAAAALMARDQGSVRIDLQVLAYPVLHCHLLGPLEMHPDSDRVERDSVDPKELAVMQWEWEQYLSSPGDGQAPYAAPLNAPTLSGMPPAIIVTAEHDILRREGELYAARLASAGVPVSLRRFEGTIHGFMELTRIGPTAAQGLSHLAAELTAARSP